MTKEFGHHEGGLRPPTERQLKFAVAIAESLHVRLPQIQTRQTLFLFIRDHRPRFDELQNRLPTPEDVDPDPYEASLLGLDIHTGGLDHG